MTTFNLDQIQLASPCHASWDEMTGDDRTRFCAQCSKHVYNLSGMTREEAVNLVRNDTGKTCVRFLRRADGTILTEDCPVGWWEVHRRVPALWALVWAMIGFLTFRAIAWEKPDTTFHSIGGGINNANT